MSSITEMLPFLGLPESFLIGHYTLLLEGVIDWKSLRRNVAELNADIAMQREFLKLYNDLVGNTDRRKAIRHNKWVTWKQLEAKVPDLFKQSLQFRKFFDTRKSKLSESEFGSFKSFVEKVRKVVTT